MSYVDAYTVKREIHLIRKAIEVNEHHLTHAGCGIGRSGLALFYLYYGRCFHDISFLNKGIRILLEAITLLDSVDYLLSRRMAYIRELSEIGILVHFLVENEFIDSSYLSHISNYDDLLADFMYKKIDENDLNEYSGATRAGNFFLNRLEYNEKAKHHLQELVLSTSNSAIQSECGGKYWIGPLYKKQGTYLGLANGSASKILFLSAVYKTGILREKCKELINEAVNYILVNRREYDYGFYPTVVGDGLWPTPLILLSGDLGVHYSLFTAAKILLDSKLEKSSVDDAIKTSRRRDISNTLVRDAEINYGAAGTALLFDRLYRETNNDVFLETADYWYSSILGYSKLENPFAGYKSIANQSHSFTNICLSEGIIGIGLSLMRFIDKNLPPIDKIFFVH